MKTLTPALALSILFGPDVSGLDIVQAPCPVAVADSPDHQMYFVIRDTALITVMASNQAEGFTEITVHEHDTNEEAVWCRDYKMAWLADAASQFDERRPGFDVI